MNKNISRPNGPVVEQSIESLSNMGEGQTGSLGFFYFNPLPF